MGIARTIMTTALLAFAADAAPIEARTLSTAETALVGVYNGGQTEIAAGLELGPDGRFRYGLSYGALDETAAGDWSLDGEQVILAGDPVTPPQIVPVERRGTPAPGLTIKLELPRGMSGQYFDAELSFADGTTVNRQLNEDGELTEAPSANPPTAVTVTLSMIDLRSDPVSLDGAKGHQLRFRFEPNDIGKVALDHTPLRRDGDDFILVRHDRTLRFRRQTTSE